MPDPLFAKPILLIITNKGIKTEGIGIMIPRIKYKYRSLLFICFERT